MKTIKGTELPLRDIKGKPYLEVQWRILWFREEHPDWSIETEIIDHSIDHCLSKATIKNTDGRVMATAFKFEDKRGFPDFIEKSNTGAVGRALAYCGFGTQFCGFDLDEGQRLADAPTEKKVMPKAMPKTKDPGDFKITFGKKYLDMTIKQAIDRDGMPEFEKYLDALREFARKKNLAGPPAEQSELLISYNRFKEQLAKDRPLNESEEAVVERWINEERVGRNSRFYGPEDALQQKMGDFNNEPRFD